MHETLCFAFSEGGWGSSAVRRFRTFPVGIREFCFLLRNFERSLARKLRFHKLKFKCLRGVSQESFVFQLQFAAFEGSLAPNAFSRGSGCVKPYVSQDKTCL